MPFQVSTKDPTMLDMEAQESRQSVMRVLKKATKSNRARMLLWSEL